MSLRTLIDSLKQTPSSGSSGRNRGRNRPDRDAPQNRSSVDGHVFRGGVWFIVSPSSVDVLTPLRTWRDSQMSDRHLPSFHAQELDESGGSHLLSLNKKIEKVNPSIVLVADGSNDLTHARAKAFVDQLPPALLSKTAVLVDSERALGTWPHTQPPKILTFEELDTLLT